MTIEYSPSSTGSSPHVIFDSHERRTVASYERELIRHRHTECLGYDRLSPREEALLCQKDGLIQQQAVLSQEFDHRLLNGLQMIGACFFAGKLGIEECRGRFPN